MSRETVKINNDEGVDAAIECDMARANAPIVYVEEGTRYSTPFQTADAKHQVEAAKALVREWVGSTNDLIPL